MAYKADPITDSEEMHICPVCGKLYLAPKPMFRHIMNAHPESQCIATDLHADLYRRWQDRNPRLSQ